MMPFGDYLRLRGCIWIALFVAGCGQDRDATGKARGVSAITSEMSVVDSVTVTVNVLNTAFEVSDSILLIVDDNQRLLQYNSTTRVVTELSRRGDGPGEWRRPTGAFLMPGGAVVLDNDGRTLLRVDHDGRVSDIARGTRVYPNFRVLGAIADTLLFGTQSPDFGEGPIFQEFGLAATVEVGAAKPKEWFQVMLQDGTMHELIAGKSRNRMWVPSPLSAADAWTAIDTETFLVLRRDGMLQRYHFGNVSDSGAVTVELVTPTSMDFDTATGRQHPDFEKRLMALTNLPMPVGRFYWCGPGVWMIQLRGRPPAVGSLLVWRQANAKVNVVQGATISRSPRPGRLVGCSGNSAFVAVSTDGSGDITVYELSMPASVR